MSLALEVASAPEAVAEQVVRHIERLGEEAILRRGRFVVALAGGSTPRLIYRRWARRTTPDWAHTVLLFGDERCVPPDHERSNYRMVAQTLLAGLPAAPQVYRMAGEHPDPRQAARDYERELRGVLGHEGRIDLALLGIGTDGHTASLFPGQTATLREPERWCLPATAPDGQSRRLTLTPALLSHARDLVFVATGSEKAEVLSGVLEGPVDPERLPAQRFIRDQALDVTVYMDEPAASQLTRRHVG